jgi:hypothetical protein
MSPYFYFVCSALVSSLSRTFIVKVNSLPHFSVKTQNLHKHILPMSCLVCKHYWGFSITILSEREINMAGTTGNAAALRGEVITNKTGERMQI